jgi:uncharacterized protein YggE
VVAAATATAVGLAAVGALGVAAAEAPTTTTASPVRTVSVQGVATEVIDQSASTATATAVYRQGMADAVSDGQAKAQFLASKAGAALGSIQSLVEDGGYIVCAGNTEYLGEQPDFGSPQVSISNAGVSSRSVGAPRPAPVVHKPVVKHHKRSNRVPSAKHASAGGCTLSAQVSLVYALS